MNKTETKEHGIIMNAEMVRATLAGRKTQTRRTRGLDPINNDDQGRTFVYHDGKVWAHCKPNELNDDFPPKTIHGGEVDFIDGKWFTPIEVGKERPLTCPYGRVGDAIYVRETWADVNTESGPAILYAADHCLHFCTDDAYPVEYERYPNCQFTMWWSDLIHREERDCKSDHRWRTSIHMPKWASRIKLRITDVRLERVNEISEDDAIAEGISFTCQQCGVVLDDSISFNKWNSAMGLPVCDELRIIKSFQRDYKVIDRWVKRFSNRVVLDFERTIVNPLETAITLCEMIHPPRSINARRVADVVIERATDCKPKLFELDM